MSDKEITIEYLKERIKKFVHDRDWSQFHNPKDLAMDISVEAAELQELFLWKDFRAEDVKNNPELYRKVCEELSDVIISGMELANVLGIDLSQAIVQKLEKNNEKYPVEKSKGKADKYTEFI